MHTNAIEKFYEAFIGTSGLALIVKYLAQFAVAVWNAWKEKKLENQPIPPTAAEAAMKAILDATERERIEREKRFEAEQQLADFRREESLHRMAEMIRDSAPFAMRDELAELIETGELTDEHGHTVSLKAVDKAPDGLPKPDC